MLMGLPYCMYCVAVADAAASNKILISHHISRDATAIRSLLLLPVTPPCPLTTI